MAAAVAAAVAVSAWLIRAADQLQVTPGGGLYKFPGRQDRLGEEINVGATPVSAE
jgi:hypothetical protein